jgi:hypothetical protein
MARISGIFHFWKEIIIFELFGRKFVNFPELLTENSKIS